MTSLSITYPNNSMPGKQIKHPQSTNFDGDEYSLPRAKRLKRAESGESTYSSPALSDDDCQRALDSPGVLHQDTNGTGDDSLKLEPWRTDLETALPPVKTDKEAIQEYESSQAAAQSELHARLGQRQWIKGKTSIYVDAFNLALETVLDEEGHLFDETELALFERWRNLNYEAQYLYVRLFLRKTSAWHRLDRLGYYSDIAHLPSAAKTLQEPCDLPVSRFPAQKNPGEVDPPEGITLGSVFTFADGSEEHITTLEEASSLLMLEELKSVAKEAKVTGKNKRELLQALCSASKKQAGLAWGNTKAEDTVDSAVLGGPHNGDDSDGINQCVRERRRSSGASRDVHFVQKILSQTGPCIRLSIAPLKLFERVHLVFYRSTEWTEKSLTTIILARISRRNFPEYVVCRSTDIFSTRAALLEFEAAIRTQSAVDNILEFNGNPRQDGFQKVLDIFEAVYPRWKALLGEEQRKEEQIYESGEGAYLRRFSPAWVYTRIVHKGAYILGRMKQYKREHELLSELLHQRLFHAARRGAWYQRKALIEEHYMAMVIPEEHGDAEMDKKQWKRIALKTCVSGLQDRDCHVIYHYELQKRIAKLEKALRVVKREQHDFSHVILARPVERVVKGVRILRNDIGGTRSASEGPGTPRGVQTVWLDEREGGGECRVEAMCLSWYREQGWKGYHSEGGILRTLFAYLFYDILFLYIPNVFQTAYQTCPLDLHTDAFFPCRASEINHRLMEIGNGAAERLIRELDKKGRELELCVVGLDWEFELEDLLEIVKCFNNEALATICKVMAQEYRQRGGGIPDLFLWHPERNEVMFVEVKSENDRLSDTQRLWIHVLTAAGVKVELCHAVAAEVRNAA